MRKGPSGMFSTDAMVRLAPAGNAAKKNTFDRKQQADRGKKIRHRTRPAALTRSCYFAAPLARAEGVAPGPDDAVGAATGVPSGSVLPDGSPK